MAATQKTKQVGDSKTMPQSLEPRWWVALTLAPGAAPQRSYVGQVQAVDDRGLRITLIDWVAGGAHNWDFYAPWDVITSVLVATNNHDLDSFSEAASKWQERVNAMDANPES